MKKRPDTALLLLVAIFAHADEKNVQECSIGVFFCEYVRKSVHTVQIRTPLCL